MQYVLQPIEDKDMLVYWLEHYLLHRQSRVRPSTFKRYKVFKHLILRFEGFRGKRIRLSNLSQGLVTEFEQYIQKEGYRSSTACRSMVFIRTLLLYAKKHDMNFRMHHIEWELHKERAEQQVILSQDELKKLEKQKLPKDLDGVRDWLLVSCYTGQRVSDFMQFTKENIKQKDQQVENL